LYYYCCYCCWIIFFLLYFPYKNPNDGDHGSKKEMLLQLVTMLRRECHGVVRRRVVVIASKEAVRVNYFLFLLFHFLIYDVFLSFEEKESFLYKFPITNSFLIWLRPQNQPLVYLFIGKINLFFFLSFNYLVSSNWKNNLIPHFFPLDEARCWFLFSSKELNFWSSCPNIFYYFFIYFCILIFLKR